MTAVLWPTAICGGLLFLRVGYLELDFQPATGDLVIATGGAALSERTGQQN